MPPDVLYNTISTTRLQSSAGIQQIFAANLTDWPCLLQPISAEFASKTGMVFGRTYTCMVQTGTDIEIGDKVVDENNKNYQVSGSLRRNYGYNVDHVTYYLTEEAQATPDI